MRKLIAKIHMSLDGFICGPSGEMEWGQKSVEEAMPDLMELLGGIDTAIMGRILYDGLHYH